MSNITTFDPLNRERPIPLAKSIRRKIASTSNPNFMFTADDDLKDAVILGFAIRRDSASRLSADGNDLLNDTLLNKGFLSIKAGGHDDIFQVPLEWFIYDPDVNAPGTYGQLMIEKWELEKSGVLFASAAGAILDEDFEMTVVYIKRSQCDLPSVAV